eukprot:795382-Pyramimonas_sp.AAC.1
MGPRSLGPAAQAMILRGRDFPTEEGGGRGRGRKRRMRGKGGGRKTTAVPKSGARLSQRAWPPLRTPPMT